MTPLPLFRHILTLRRQTPPRFYEREEGALATDLKDIMTTICTATLGSLTYAIKGQKLLSENSISAKIVKLDASQTRRGCSYGIEFDCREQKKVRRLFSTASLPVSGYMSGGGGELL